MITLSVVIICWNSEKYIKTCLDSLLESARHISKEIIIIDNGSSDRTLPIIRSYPAGTFTLICNTENLGVAKARNLGLRRVSGKYIWILDVDTKVNEEAVTGMLDFMDKNPDCGICACKLVNFQGVVQDSCRKHPSFLFKVNNVLESLFDKLYITRPLKKIVGRCNERQFYREEMRQKQPFEVEYVIGACQMVRLEGLKKVGLLDENFFYGPEDTDFCLRMENEGYRVYYIPSFIIVHDYQQITNKKLISPISLLHLKALFYYFWKHKRF